MAYTSEEMKEKLKLYSYWRSSCGHRVRIALSLKGIEYEYIPVNLLKGEQFDPDFMKINPMGTVPALVDGEVVITDSFAIIMYLDEKYPEPPLLPRDLHKRALNYQVASIISSGIQPHQNLAVIRYIEEKTNGEEKIAWINNAIRKGYTALEKLLVNYAGIYATGDEIYLADLFLVAQVHGAMIKFKIDVQNIWTTKLNSPNLVLPKPIFFEGMIRPLLVFDGWVSLSDISGGYTENSSCCIMPYLSCGMILLVGSPGLVSISPSFSSEKCPLSPSLLSVKGDVFLVSLPSISFSFFTGLLSCGAVCTGPEDAIKITHVFLVGESWLSTSLVTISQLSDFVVKALSTQSSFVLISLSSSLEELSILTYFEPYPTLAKCYESYKELSVFEDAVPAKQPDAPAPMI
uniref:glutathione transferase n=2 Tax=Brassica campestris TaxID=3711 RepID=M4ECU1_BRACM